MMQCPSCSAVLISGQARCGSCHALVNPPVHGASALAPRLVTPQAIDGPKTPSAIFSSAEESWENALGQTSQLASPRSVAAPASADPESEISRLPGSTSRNPVDEAWRREVLERVRKRRQVRSRALPLFVEGEAAPRNEPAAPSGSPLGVSASRATTFADEALDEAEEPSLKEQMARYQLGSLDPRSPLPAPDLIAALDVPLSQAAEDDVFDLPLRPAESEGPRGPGPETTGQSLVERPRPTLTSVPGSRSLVGGLPLVEPSRLDVMPKELPSRKAFSAVSSRAASLSDRMQAAFIDVGIWSATSVTAFYFASRIARTSLAGLGPAWQGLAVFGFVLAAAYILFFGGLSGATPGKIACGIQVKRYDGSSLGPLVSLGRGLLGILGVAFLGLGIWPAFWDKDRRALHDRATDSRVTTV